MTMSDRFTSARAVTLSLLLLVSAFAIGLPAGTVTAAGSTDVVVQNANQTVVEGDTTTYTVVVSNADGGVGAFNLSASVDSSVATIQDISVESGLSPEGSTKSVDGSSASLEAFGLNTSDTGSVAVATVTVEATSGGSSAIDLQLQTLGDENGDAYTVSTVQDGTLTVESDSRVVFDPQSQSATEGSETTYDVIVTNVPGDGVGAYDYTVNVDSSVANITDVSLKGNPGIGGVQTNLPSPSVSISAAGANTNDSGNVTIATITVSGNNSGTTPLSLNINDIGGEGGNSIPVQSEDGSLTVQSPATFDVSGLSAPATVNEGENFTVEATITNTGDVAGSEEVEFRVDGTALANQTVSLDAGNSTTVTFTSLSLPDAGTFTHGVFTGDDNQTAQIKVQPVASVTFDNQTVSEGASELTVASAQFGDGDDGDYVVVVHQVASDGSIGAKIGESDVLASGTQTDIAVDLQALDGGINNLTQSQELVAMLHTANTSDGDDINHGTNIIRNGSPVTDRAFITVEQAATFDVSGLSAPATVNEGENFTVEATITNTGDVAGSEEVEFRVDGTALANQTVSLSAGETTTVTFSGLSLPDAGTFTHGVFTSDDSATAQIEVQPVASVAFDNQTVTEGASEVTVASAQFGDGDDGDYVVVVHQVASDGSIGTKIGESGVLASGTQTDIAVDLQALDGGINNLTQSQELVAMLHTANTSDGDDINHGTNIIRNGSPVTDRAFITVEQAATFDVSGLSAPATVNEGENFTVEATITNTGDVAGSEEVEFRVDGTALANQTVSLDAGNSTTVTFSGLSLPDAGTFTHGVFTGDDNQTAQIEVQPVASVTFDNQTVIEGASEVTVASAQFGNGDDGNFVVVVHRVASDDSIGAKIGESDVLSSGTESNITVDLQGLNTPDNLTESQELVAMLHTANTSDGDDINHGTNIIRNGSPVTDRAFITVEQAATFDVSGLSAPATVNEGENFTVEATITNTGDVAGDEAVEFRIGGTVGATQNVSLDAGNSTTVTFSGLSLPDAGTFTHGVFTGDDNQTAQIEVQPVASVTFDNQTVTEGASEVTVASAQFGDGDDGNFVVVVHRVASDDSIGAKIGESDVLASGTESNITVDLQGLSTPDNLTQSQELVAMLHTANTSDGDDINHGTNIIRNGLPVTDRAFVTVEPAGQADLAVTDVQTSVQEVLTGETVDITAEVANTGNASGNITVEFTQNGTDIRTQTVTVPANSTDTVSITSDTFQTAGDVPVSAGGNGTSASTTVTVLEPADIQLTDINVTSTSNVSYGETFNVTATVENLGDLSGNETITFRVDADDDGDLETIETRTVSIDGEETETTTFQFQFDTDQETTPHVGSAFNSSQLVGDTVSLSVESESEAQNASVSIDAPGAIGSGSSGPAQDLDNDGVFEDLNGDGRFNLGDVFQLFSNIRDANTTPGAFDLNGDGEITVVDVQLLFREGGS